jgi:hypothetical protein
MGSDGMAANVSDKVGNFCSFWRYDVEVRIGLACLAVVKDK